MLYYFRFHADLPHPRPAQPVYIRRGAGSGWPEHCPPIRAANAFGFDIINPFDMHFIRDDEGNWEIEEAIEVESDIEFENGVVPHPQLNAWFWERGQQRPHVITDNVYRAIRHQVKVSSFLFLHTDPDELLLIKGIPFTNAGGSGGGAGLHSAASGARPEDEVEKSRLELPRVWSVIEAVADSDWYFPAHPWHGVIELPRIEDRPDITEVLILAGEPIFRIIPVSRALYEAVEMDSETFGDLFEEGQQWLGAHGRDYQEAEGDVDITGSYAKQQQMAEFAVIPADDEGDDEEDSDEIALDEDGTVNGGMDETDTGGATVGEE